MLSASDASVRFPVALFDWIDPAATEDLRELYERRIEIIQYAEDTGFSAYQVAEHHGTPLSVAPSASVFLAAVAQRTSRIRLCPLVYLLPMHHPIRLAEEIAMLDHLCDGRLDVGVGRGASPYELQIFGVSIEDSRAVFDETLSILVQALSTGRVTHHGTHYDFDDVLVSIRPRQQPYPPLWYPTISASSVPWIAGEGLHTVYGFGFLSPSLDDTRAQADLYYAEQATERRRPEALNAHVADRYFGVMRQIYIADDDATAYREARDAFHTFYKAFDYLWAAHNNNRFPRQPNFDSYLDDGLVLVGSPDTVRDKLVRIVEKTRANFFAGAFNFGDMEQAQIMRSMQLFNEQVRPSLDEIVDLEGASA